MCCWHNRQCTSPERLACFYQLYGCIAALTPGVLVEEVVAITEGLHPVRDEVSALNLLQKKPLTGKVTAPPADSLTLAASPSTGHLRFWPGDAAPVPSPGDTSTAPQAHMFCSVPRLFWLCPVHLPRSWLLPPLPFRLQLAHLLASGHKPDPLLASSTEPDPDMSCSGEVATPLLYPGEIPAEPVLIPAKLDLPPEVPSPCSEVT